MHLVPLALQCGYGCSDQRSVNGDGDDGKEWRLLGLLYADEWALCGELEEDLE